MPEAVQPIFLQVNFTIRIHNKKQHRRCFCYNRCQCRSTYSHFRESTLSEYHRIVEEYIHQGHDDSIHGQYLCFGYTYIKRTEHDIDKGEKESPDTPCKKLVCSMKNSIRSDQQTNQWFGTYQQYGK